jgi:hypothetical protein
MAVTLNASTSSGLVQTADTSGDIALQNNGTTAITVTGGNVGIGTTSPTTKLHVTNSSSTNATGYFNNTSGSGDSPALIVQGGANNAGTVGAFEVRNYNGSTRFYVGGDGAISAGSTTQTVGLGVWSNYGSRIVDFARYADDGAIVGFKRAGTLVGNISVTGSATAYNTSSDYRLKENIAPIQNALNVVQQLKPVTYNWKSDGSVSQGFIAHELQAVVPDCVTGEKDAVDSEGNPVYQGIDTSFLVATLTAAIQELKAELDATKAEVAALKGVA